MLHALTSDQIHVWRIPLNQTPDRIPELTTILSAEERDRARLFHFEKDSHQFIESRAALRGLLGQYLNVAAASLAFTLTAYGKPALATGDLRFNLSRRDGLALIAFTRGREIGVDVELVRPDLDLFEIAGVSFSENELASMNSLPESQRAAGFYNCWTRKEAFVKAVGQGLSFPLKQFDVSLTPGEPARLISIRRDSSEAFGGPHSQPGVLAEAEHWTLRDIPVPHRYVAALAYSGPTATLTCTDWQ